VKTLRIFLRIFLPLVAIGLGIFVARKLIASRPISGKKPPASVGVLVETAGVVASTRATVVRGYGTVGPAREVTLQPQVSGRVLEVNPELVPGGRIAEGALLVRIESSDYDLQVAQARTQVETAKQNLELEKGRRTIAEREWNSLSAERRDKADPSGRSRALREPQIRQADAALDAAQATLRQARLNVSRTRIEAPFAAMVQTESLEVGQVVSPATAAAKLVGIDTYWITVNVPMAELQWLTAEGARAQAPAPAPAVGGEGGEVSATPTVAAEGARATVRVDTGHGIIEREGRVARLLGELDPLGRQARLVVAVDDPLGLKNGATPLLLGSYVEVEIEGRPLDNVVEVARLALHEGDKAYVFKNGELEVRDLTVIRRLRDVVLVNEGLAPGDTLITSRIATPIPGMKLRQLSDVSAAPASRAELPK
jgi:RND family efflux transporter MFP subunit